MNSTAATMAPTERSSGSPHSGESTSQPHTTAHSIFATETLIVTEEHENTSYTKHVVGEPPVETLSFILIPLMVILGVAIVSGLAIYCMNCIQRKRRLDNLRHTLIPMYTFSRADEDEWGVLLDNYDPQHSQQTNGSVNGNTWQR